MKNKKFMSRLFSAVLAGAMVLSMAPAAFAAATDHDCWAATVEKKYVDNHDGSHDYVCCVCDTVLTAGAKCVWESGECICGSKESVNKPAATDHVCWDNVGYNDNLDGTHDVICTKCEKVLKEGTECVWESGECVCGSKKPVNKPVATDHVCWDNVGYNDNLDGTHDVICTKCEKVLKEGAECVWESGECACGSTAPECNHTGNHWDYVVNEDGKTHKVICADCDTVMNESAECVWESGECVCGSTAPECNHTGNHWDYVVNEDGKTHKVICTDCDAVVTESAECVWEAGKCVCGSEKPEETPSAPSTPSTPSTPSAPSTSNTGVSILGGLLEGAGLVGFFRILFKALFHI